MPSWPARLFINSSIINSTTSSALVPADSQSPNGDASHVDVGNSLQHSPHSPATPSGSNPKKPNSRHGRSISHPFPSIFSPSKKAHRTQRALDMLDMTDDEIPVTNHGQATSNLPKGRRGHSENGNSQGLASGRCMTCDRSIRWPADVKVFRCSICATINDTEPVVLEIFRHDCNVDVSVGMIAENSGLSVHSPMPPLSVEKTRIIIDRCINSYLQTRRSSSDVSKESPLPSPPQSPCDETFDEVSDDTQDNLEGKTLPAISRASTPQRWVTTPANHHPRSPGLGDSGRHCITLQSQPDLKSTVYSSSSPSEKSSSLEYMHRINTANMCLKTTPSLPRMRVDSGAAPLASITYLERSKEKIDRAQRLSRPLPSPPLQDTVRPPPRPSASTIFKPLEDYLIASFAGSDCLNSSFGPNRPGAAPRAFSEGTAQAFNPDLKIAKEDYDKMGALDSLPNLDAKTVLLGDFAENGCWWTGNRPNSRGLDGRPHTRDLSVDGRSLTRNIVSPRSPRIDWAQVHDWYQVVLEAGRSWRSKWHEIERIRYRGNSLSELNLKELTEKTQDIEEEIMKARIHVQETLLKVIETLLKRPGRPLKHPENIRFLLILLANPLLYPGSQVASLPTTSSSICNGTSSKSELNEVLSAKNLAGLGTPPRGAKGGPRQHSGVIKRILGLLSNLPNECHHHLISWFSRFSELQYRKIVELIGSFVTYRLSRQNGQKRASNRNPSPSLIPDFSATGVSSPAQLHAALGLVGPRKTPDGKPIPVIYAEDWQIKAAARIMSLLFAANSSGHPRRIDPIYPPSPGAGLSGSGLAAQRRARTHGQILPTSAFYNTLLDYSDLVSDFEVWESQRGRFAFCQYPFFLSIGAKIRVLEHDARRQMEVKAREAFFNSIVQRNSVSQHLILKVRRECLVEDSLREVSETVGAGQEEIKKSLRVEFLGEEGIDAGGLKKEWFLLLVRDIFDPDHGLFIYDEDSHYCYFDPNCFETSDQFFLVGVLLGLAIYNSTILDVPLPPFAFKKLLASAPSPPSPLTHSLRSSINYTLDDLAEYRPSLASGLRKLLDFEGDVEETYCREFVAEIDRYGQVLHVPLCPNGETRQVTNDNRREFVDLYIRYLLDVSVTRQFEPFKRGFYTVCSGNALSLFRPEEIELLVRGSDEPLDVSSLRAVAAYDNWGCASPGDTIPIILWFWEIFEGLNSRDQRKLLSFITGSDRIPAMGTVNLTIKIKSIGEDCERFPIARTCFNSLGLYRYSSKEKLETKLLRAVSESEGFGLK